MRIYLVTAALASLGATVLNADFSYQQTSQMTGGAMMSMMRMLGPFAKQAREPHVSSVMVKGDRMVTLSKETAHIIDLSKETVTDINFAKKTYSVLTFEQMRQAMQDAAKQIEEARKQPQQQPDVEAHFKVSAKETGLTKVISGLNAKEVVVTLEMEGADKQSGQKSSLTTNMDIWLAPEVSGYREVREFHRKMAMKMAGVFAAGNPMAMMRPELMKQMVEVGKEMSKLDGVPVLQIVRMGGTAEGAQTPEGAAAAPAQPQPAPPSAGDVAGGAATGAAASRMGRLGGLAGGLGGLGRKKKQDPPQQEQPPQQQAPPQPAQSAESGAASAGTLLETTTELTSFSGAPVDASKFDVPAGFKQVEPEMTKRRAR